MAKARRTTHSKDPQALALAILSEHNPAALVVRWEKNGDAAKIPVVTLVGDEADAKRMLACVVHLYNRNPEPWR